MGALGAVPHRESSGFGREGHIGGSQPGAPQPLEFPELPAQETSFVIQTSFLRPQGISE